MKKIRSITKNRQTKYDGNRRKLLCNVRLKGVKDDASGDTVHISLEMEAAAP